MKHYPLHNEKWKPGKKINGQRGALKVGEVSNSKVILYISWSQLH